MSTPAGGCGNGGAEAGGDLRSRKMPWNRRIRARWSWNMSVENNRKEVEARTVALLIENSSLRGRFDAMTTKHSMHALGKLTQSMMRKDFERRDLDVYIPDQP